MHSDRLDVARSIAFSGLAGTTSAAKSKAWQRVCGAVCTANAAKSSAFLVQVVLRKCAKAIDFGGQGATTPASVSSSLSQHTLGQYRTWRRRIR
eukprot:2898370-Rhodomonas_salina.2